MSYRYCKKYCFFWLWNHLRYWCGIYHSELGDKLNLFTQKTVEIISFDFGITQDIEVNKKLFLIQDLRQAQTHLTTTNITKYIIHTCIVLAVLTLELY